MPEEQKPFEHQTGRRLPNSISLASPAKQEFFAPHRLGALMDELRRVRPNGHDPRTLAARQKPYDDAIYALSMLREPQLNSIAVAMASFTESEGAILASLAIALLSVGTKKHRLLAAVRTAIEDLS